MPTLAQIEADRARSAEFVFRLTSGASESVYVNPYDGAVLGTLSVEHRLMKQVRNLHRGLMMGKTGALIMELAGCWTLVMIGTGIALWWPDHTDARNGGVWLPRLSLQGRAWWRDLHAVGGIWLAAGALFFVLSGLPWSGSWGKEFKALATSASLGYPAGAWGEAHVHSTAPGAAAKPAAQSADKHAMHGMHMQMDDLPLRQTPWAVSATRVPDGTNASASVMRVLIEDVVALAAKQGVTDDYGIALPNKPTGVYTVSYFPADPRARTHASHRSVQRSRAGRHLLCQLRPSRAMDLIWHVAAHGALLRPREPDRLLGNFARARGPGHYRLRDVDEASSRTRARCADARMARRLDLARRNFPADGRDDARRLVLGPARIRGEARGRLRHPRACLCVRRSRTSAA